MEKSLHYTIVLVVHKIAKKMCIWFCFPVVANCEKENKVMKDWIETNKEQFQTFEKNTKTALTFLVGAFVKLIKKI